MHHIWAPCNRVIHPTSNPHSSTNCASADHRESHDKRSQVLCQLFTSHVWAGETLSRKSPSSLLILTHVDSPHVWMLWHHGQPDRKWPGPLTYWIFQSCRHAAGAPFSVGGDKVVSQWRKRCWQSQLFTFYATTHFDTRRIFDDSGGAWSWRSDAEQRSQWNFARGELSRLKLPESCKCGWIDIRYAVCGFTYCQLLSALLLFLFLCWRIKPLFCRRKATPWQIVCGGRVKGRQGSSCWVFREATTPITERIAKNCLWFHLEKEAIQKDHSRCISIVIKTEVVQPEKKNGRQSLSFFLTFMLGNDRHAKTAWGRDAIWTPGRCYPVRFRAFLNAQCKYLCDSTWRVNQRNQRK